MKRGDRDLSPEGRALAVSRARTLRKTMTPPEARLWLALRRKTLAGFRFRRQCPIGPYVLDFYCAKASLAVEVDGEDHGLGDQPRRDARRDAWMARRGIRTLRFAAIEVRDNLDGVVATLIAVLAGDL